jgi:hypothetical protein
MKVLRSFVLVLASVVAAGVQEVYAQSVLSRPAHTPGVSVRLLQFVDTGPPHVSIERAMIVPVTNQTFFGPRISGVGPTNITYTNSITGGPAAVFQYTNASLYPTFVAVQSLEYPPGSTWKAVPLPTEAKRMVLVPPTSAVTQTIPVTATNVAWRMTAFCVEQAKGISRAVESAGELIKQTMAGQKTEHFSGRKYLIKSNAPTTR